MATSDDSLSNNDEIDLAELFYSLWSQKILIGIVSGACLVLTLLYLSRATPEYKASVIFQINNQQTLSNFSSDLTGLASLAGFSLGKGSEDNGVFDRLSGRDFIVGVAEEMALYEDPYFNPFLGEQARSPVLIGLSALKSMIVPAAGDSYNDGDGDRIEEARLAEDAIVNRFSEAVIASPTTNGSILIEAFHEKPHAAAALANTTMNRLLAALASELEAEQVHQLSYLSEQLADAQAAVSEAQERVQDFALQNSLVSITAFATRSEQMVRLRDELQRSDAMSAAIVELLDLIGSGSEPTAADLARLRVDFPILDDVSFRRLLYIPEKLDQWVWPEESRLLEFRGILADRAARARLEVERLQTEAEEYARASDELGALKRDAAIAEATYQVLIEQTKAHSFMAGFNPDVAKIYQVAVAPTGPSSPKKSLVAALGLVLGFFGGSGLALWNSARRGRLYTERSVKETAQAGLFLRTPLRGLRSRKVRSLIERAERLRPKALLALAMELNENPSRGVLCVSAGSRTHAAGPALWLAAELSKDHDRVAMIDLSGDLGNLEAQGAQPDDGPWQRLPVTGALDLLAPVPPRRADDILARSSFGEDVRALLTRYDRVVFSAAPAHADMAHRALHRNDFYLVVVCADGLTKRANLSGLREIAAIDACLSEA